MRQQPTWFVTFEQNMRGVLPKTRRARETKTFEIEADAKKFARSKLTEGMIVFAGTINPHLPKRVILSSDIHDWVADDQTGTP